MQRVLVLDSQKQPLMPCDPARARMLLKTGRAAVFRRFPFTLILKDRVGGEVQPMALKIDPGSQTTGVAVTADFKRSVEVVWGAEIEHRGQAVHESLLRRRQKRRSRRQRHTRYRAPRFDNRSRPVGWLPPSLESRIQNIMTWVGRLCRVAP